MMKKVTVCAAAVLPSLLAMPARAQEAITTPILTSVDNFRDLAGLAASKGGTGYAYTTAHDGVMRTGVFFRSNALTLNDADLATISGQNISTVIDLRTPGEISKDPDVLWPGVTYFNNNVSGGNTSETPPLRSPADSIALLEGANRSFVTDARTRSVLREVFLELAHADAAALYHCTAGKDRTGWISAVLQSIAGVSQEEIMKDYLASNTYSAERIKASLDAIAAQAGGGAAGEYARAIYAPLMGVQASFLQAGLDQVAASYGSMDNYLKEGLGLTQADIYVLRAKMVYYQSLPEEDELAGNAAAGAALLKALQNSELSGEYTAYNYYLQSAIDAGTLGGVAMQVGGQVHADADAWLLRLSSQLSETIQPYAQGRGLDVGQAAFWQTTLGESFSTDGDDGAAKSSQRSVMPLFGATWRVDERALVYGALGYGGASISAAGGKVELDGFLATLGGRYGFSSLDAGFYVAGGINASIMNYDSTRTLGGGLGTADGSTDGTSFGANAEIGHIFRSGEWSVTPFAGIDISHAKLDAFSEKDSELALAVEEFSDTAVRVKAGLEVGLDKRKAGNWTVSTTSRLTYEYLATDPAAVSTASVQGFTIDQQSAFNSRNLGRLGFDVALEKDALTLKAGINGAIGDGRESKSIGGKLSIGYAF
jgi:protein-tyrosine phosphatase